MKTRSRLVFVLVFLVVAGFLAYMIFSGQLASADDRKPLEGYLAPDFSLPDASGKRVSLSDFEGKPVFLNFWASWCGPCQDEMPELVAAEKRFGNKVQFVGINLTTEERYNGAAEQFLQHYQVPYLNLFDKKGKAKKAYQIIGIPTSFLLDENGQIVYKHQGEITLEQLEKAMEKLNEKNQAASDQPA